MTNRSVVNENHMDSSDDEQPRPRRKKSRAQLPESSDSADEETHEPATPVPLTMHNLVENYRNLTNEMCNLDIRPDNTLANARRATTLMDQADELADMAYGTSGSAATTYDGEFLNVAGQVVHQIAEKMEVDSRIFCVKEFAACFKNFAFGSRNAPVTKSGLADFYQKHIRPMGNNTAPVHKYLHGAYDFARSGEPVPPAEGPARRKRTRLVVSPTKTQAAVIRSDESLLHVDKDETVIEVELLQQRIEQLYVKNDCNPVPFLTVVMNSENFGKTVENVFHFSFLVKEGYCSITSHNGISSVVPVEEEERKALLGSTTDESRQFIFSFNKQDWTHWKQKVKQPAYKVG